MAEAQVPEKDEKTGRFVKRFFGPSPARRMREAQETSNRHCVEAFERAHRDYLESKFLLRQNVLTDG